MEDAEIVAAIAAGDPGGLREALDRYVTALFGYCRAVLVEGALPADDAAEAVLDTFIIAASRLDGLADPTRLGPWLHAVARNECYRRLLAVGMTPHEPTEFTAGSAAWQGRIAQTLLPEDLPGRILTACADNTPTGRAHRASVTHRAGAFGHDGFPRPVIRPRPPMWRRRAVAVAVVAVAVTAAVVIALASSGSRPGQVSAAGAGGGGVADGLSTPSAKSTATVRASHPSPGGRARAGTATSPGSSSSATASPASPAVPSRPTSPSVSPSASASPSASPSPSLAQGTLVTSTTKLSLVSVAGQRGLASFSITAASGPVGYFRIAVISGAASVSATPQLGSLAAGSRIAIEVSAASKVSFNATLILYPGSTKITVQVIAKA